MSPTANICLEPLGLCRAVQRPQHWAPGTDACALRKASAPSLDACGEADTKVSAWGHEHMNMHIKCTHACKTAKRPRCPWSPCLKNPPEGVPAKHKAPARFRGDCMIACSKTNMATLQHLRVTQQHSIQMLRRHPNVNAGCVQRGKSEESSEL